MTIQTGGETICYTPAVELARQIRTKEMSPVDIADAFIGRIEELNPKLNAFVTLHEDQTRREAAAAAEAIANGSAIGMLHGVPISIKDLARTRGVRTTCGSRVYEDYVPIEDAPVVERLRAAGAVCLGKTNTPEFGWLAITDNPVFGRTNNPWNLDYTTSGSSGGAAAAVAAGLSPIAHGSDGGGSIRHPASFCGVFGIKPTFGVVPRHPCVDGWPSLSHHGPLTRTVADAALALDVMGGYDSRDMYSAPVTPPGFLSNIDADITGLRVAWSTDLGFAEVDPEVRDNFESRVGVFEELGCEVTNAQPDVADAREIFKGVMFVEAVGSDLQYIEEDGTSRMSPELTAFIWKRRDMLARDYMAAQQKRQEMYKRVHDFFEAHDLLITPTMAIPPFRHPRDLSEYPHAVSGVEVGATGWHPFTFPFNLTGQPAASAPSGFSREGLPLGIQFVGRRFEDLLVLQAARRYEEAQPWAGKTPRF